MVESLARGGQAEVCWVEVAGKPSARAELVWPKNGRPGVDAALLRVELPRAVSEALGHSGRVVVLSRTWPREGQTWGSRGVIDGGGSGGPGAIVPYGGVTYCPSSPMDLRFELDLRNYPQDPKGWHGASGSPVCIERSVRGVIVSYPEAFAGRRLTAVSLFGLREDRDFCQLVGWDRRSPRVDRLRWDFSRLLEGSRELFDALRSQPNLSCGHWQATSPAELVELLLHGDLADVLVACNRAHKVLFKTPGPTADARSGADARSAAKGLVAIVDELLSLLYGADCVAQIRENAGTPIVLDVPIRYPTVAEIAMSAAQDIPTEWNLKDQEPIGTCCVELPPELRTGSLAQTVVEHLAAALLPQSGRTGELPELAAAVDAKLKVLASDVAEPRRRYLLLSPDTYGPGEAAELAQLLPNLCVLELKGGTDGLYSEERVRTVLTELLVRARDQEKQPS